MHIRVLLICFWLVMYTIAGAQPLVLTNGTIVDPSYERPAFRASIVIDGERITYVGDLDQFELPEDARTIDLAGKYVIPGLIDAHNHLEFGHQSATLGPAEVLKLLPAWGVTAVFDTTVDMESFRKLKSDAPTEDIRARFFAVGRSIGAKDGWGGTLTEGYAPADEEQARNAVRELASAGVDGIKLVYDDMSEFGYGPWPMLDPAVMQAIVDEAHQQSLKAYVHALILEHAKTALRSGADVLVHGVISDPIDEEFLQLMRANGAYYVPTHIVYELYANKPAMSARYEALDHRMLIDRSIYKSLWDARYQSPTVGPQLPVLRENLRRVVEAGIPVAMGSDTGVPGVLAGIASQMELVLYVESAMSPLQALAAATTTAAEMIGQSEYIGSIKPAKYADLVVLESDPLEDIRNISDIWAVMIGGKFALAPQPLQ